MEKTCQKCGSPASQIPPKAEWGTQVTSQKTGKKYYVFLKCEACNWSLSSDPNPRKFTRKPQNSIKSGDSDAFKDELRKTLQAIVVKLDDLSFQVDAVEALLKTNKEV